MSVADRIAVRAFEEEFAALRRTAEKAVGQLDVEQIRVALDSETNSVAVILKHLAGNLRSRFTRFLDEDGEKPWRERDREFVDDFPSGAEGRAAILAAWESGWRCVDETLAALDDVDLGRIVTIRGEPQTAARALARAVGHVGYHVGQIVQIARTVVGPGTWQVISIRRGGSAEFNRTVGFEPRSG